MPGKLVSIPIPSKSNAHLMETDMPHLPTIPAAALAGCLIISPLQAKEIQATLQYDPAELTTPDGAAAVYKRLRLSAKRACEVPSPIQQRQEFDCRRNVESDLVAQVGSPILLAMHREAERRVRIAKVD